MKTNKKTRQYAGLIAAVLAYYLIHEGAHLVTALCMGVFKTINVVGVMGVQIDVYNEMMSDTQMGVFCLMGPVATLVTGWLLVALAGCIGRLNSSLLRAVLYYITIIMLLLDPLYMSVICGMVGGGDMNGIALLMPETAARIAAGILLVVNGLLFWKRVLPVYTASFKEQGE